MTEWTDYAVTRPDHAQVYEWRIPSAAVEGMTVVFLARMRERGAGHRTVLSPPFDHWDGWNVIVPAGTQWRVPTVEFDPKEVWNGCHAVRVEDLTLTDCPFCRKAPTLVGIEKAANGGVFSPSAPHLFNSWRTKCCSWAQSPAYRDPRDLETARSALLRAA